MHRLGVFLIFSWLGAMTISCTKQEVTPYQMEQSLNFTISAGLSPSLSHVFFWNLESPLDSYLKTHGLSLDQVTAVKPADIYIEPVLNSSFSYALINSAKVTVAPREDLNLFIPIAEEYPLPNIGSGVLHLTGGIADVKSILKTIENHTELVLRFRDIPSSTSNHRLVVRYNVFVK
ncbi:MAG: hypothetical protein IPM86_11645 [Saprospiraceae bacterium]|nr:hypothetical protein [Saprospiraceae bacterium]